VYRAGIESVHPSQEAAARSLGLSRWQTTRRVILPQAVRRGDPAAPQRLHRPSRRTARSSRRIGAVEAFNQSQIDTNATFNFTAYLSAAVLFVALTIPLARFTDWLVAREPSRAAGGEAWMSEALAVEGLVKSFGKHTVLKGIDLAVGEHEVIALIGASGSGKSDRCCGASTCWSRSTPVASSSMGATSRGHET